jgi:hypothetical protein
MSTPVIAMLFRDRPTGRSDRALRLDRSATMDNRPRMASGMTDLLGMSRK